MNTSKTPKLAKFSVALVLGVTLLSACGQKKPEALMASARDYIAKKDFPAASIQLKSALQQQDSGEVRYLLATTLIEMGDLSGAEIQLRRAVEAQYAPDLVYPELARVLAGLGEFKKLSTEFAAVKTTDPKATASIKAILGEAFYALGQANEARSAFAEALTANPEELRARVGEARLIAAEGDAARATTLVDAVLAKAPSQPQALALKADLLIAQAKPDEAAAVLTTLIGVVPAYGQPRFALISLLIAQDKLEPAAAAIAAMKKAIPQDVRWRYLEAVLAFRKAQPQQARDAVLQVLNAIPDHGPSLLLAGAAEYQLGALATAENYLRKVISIYPNNLYARNLLVATYLRKGQPQKAEEILAPGLTQAPKDPTILRAAGEVAFANNRFADAAKYYEQAIAVEKDNAPLRTRLAQIRLATGETARALDDFETASGMDKNAYQADLSLISTYISQKAYDKALAAANALEKKQPDNPISHVAKGTVYLARQDIKNGRISLEKALSLKYNFLPAARILAGLDLNEKNPAAAVARFENILAKEPANDGALLGLAETQISAKVPARDILATLDRAIKANPTLPSARVALVKFHAQNKDPQAALAAAKTASTALPNDPTVLDTLGLAQLGAGDTAQAIETFNKLATMQPDSPLPLMRLAAAQYSAKQLDAPIQALRKALSMKPDLLDAQRQLIVAQLAAGRADEALKETKAVQKSRPKEAVGFVLEGDVLANQKKHVEAANAYAEGIKRQPQPELVGKQIELLKLAGKSAEANAIASKWLQENPKDPVVRFQLANAAIQANDLKTAAVRYREVLAIQPDNLAILNNLSWVLSELKDPAALGFAEKAYNLAPDNPDVQDTYGWLLAGKGDSKRGIELLTKAVTAMPKATEARLHLAKALLNSGDKAGAKRELETLVAQAPSKDAALKAEAEKLLQTL